MKKYFMCSTNKELQFDDMIEITLTRDLPNGKEQCYKLECKFIPAIVPLLLENNIIAEKLPVHQPKKTKDTNAVAPDNDLIQNMLATSEELEHRVERLEGAVVNLIQLVMGEGVLKHCKNCHNAKRTARK